MPMSFYKSNMSQTITTAAKLAAAFTSLSPDVWASDVRQRPWISSFILFSFQVILKLHNTQKSDLGLAAYIVRAHVTVCSQRLDVPEAFNQEMFSISSPHVPILDLWSS